MSERKLYKIDQDWGRGFSVEALFTAHPEDIALLSGHTVYFGEIAGKYSEISLDINSKTLKEVEATPEIIAWLEENLSSGDEFGDWNSDFHTFTISGHNPFCYWEGPEDEDDEEWD